MTYTTAPRSISSLPAIGGSLEGGIFVGLTTTGEGQHVAVVLMPDRQENVSADAAAGWAASLSASLPSCAECELIIKHAPRQLPPLWHWTSDQEGDDLAWCFHMGYGGHAPNARAMPWAAAAVRRVPMSG